ncbi:MAG: UpxY family transcription antiterminator [Armatimonadetes bacterium]|nr:UpxY family transcription antiterminator [Armatimonadota bacterium]
MATLTAAWYAIYTRNRHEKQVDAYLRQQRLQTYLPLLHTWSSRQDRRQLIDVPALPGYLFVHCALWPEIRAVIKRNSGVVRLVEHAGRPAVIPPEQIESLRIALESGQPASPHPCLKVGDRVRVTRGHFKGVTGHLMRVAPGRCKLVISIDFINRAVCVEIDASAVEKDR